MCHNIKKISLNFQEYKNYIFLIKKENNLIIKGFFGETSLKIPNKIFLEIKDSENDKIINLFYLNEKLDLRIIKSFYNLIIFSINNCIFNNFEKIYIKGIGYKFILEEYNLNVFNGNSLPVIFKIPEGVEILNNGSFNNLTLLGGDFILLKNFINNIIKIAKPNKYKEIGVFIENKVK